MAELGDGVTRGVPALRLGLQDALRTTGGALALRNPSAAYEVDDFQLVAFGQVGFGPLLAWDDAAVQLYRDAVLFHAELFD